MSTTMKVLAVIVAIAGITLICAYQSVSREEMAGRKQKLTIEDVIRKMLGKSEGNLTKDDYAKIKHLEVTNQEEVNLDDLQFCTNLRRLNLSGNQIKDISLLANLKDLTELDLHDNQIDDLTPLAGLTKLATLNLDRNQITDISALASLNNLQTLILANNKIADTEPLEGLVNLRWLDLGANSLDIITPMTKLSKLEYLNLINVSAYYTDSSQKSISDLKSRGTYIETNWQERGCVRMLHYLGSAELAYRDGNTNGDFGTWESLAKNKYLRGGRTRENFINSYSIAVFNVNASSLKNRKQSRNDSTFTIVAIPRPNQNSLRTYAISTSQIARVWIGDDKLWSWDQIMLNDPKLWKPIR